MFLSKLFDSNDRQVNNLRPLVAEINKLEPWAQALADVEIKAKTMGWKTELMGMPDTAQAAYLERILPEAFALVRESGKRSLRMRHFDVQLLAGIVLHRGKIAEQKTGEGKTLTATLPLYLNSLAGKGVHLVTPNDYLSRHGAGWMGPLYALLGVSVGVIMQERSFVYDPSFESREFEDAYAVHLREVPRQEAYKCDITYGTNHEFGFDYLRDNMVRQLGEMVQTCPRGDFGLHTFGIVDEVDSILIDVARTPLIISVQDAKPSDRYHEADSIVKGLVRDIDYDMDEKVKSASLTDLGIRKVERLLGIKNLYEQDFEMVHLLEQALVAHALFARDRDYVVKNGQVIIVDQFTGRILVSNRFSHGLHQALEAKEHVRIQEESKTLAEISYQNYFRMYAKLAGMTGTAATEAEEFFKIYKLDVVVIPTNKPLVRTDSNDVVYKTEAGKFKAVANEIEEKHKSGQPVLVGTTSVEKSELLHEFLKRKGIPHEILNAKNHEREALIIAQAGRQGAVTISTNMAGRGVDIILGGDPPDLDVQAHVLKAGGLHVIGTERHESRRIDNQLRGRAGRQGDPGSTKFFVSLQDDLMRIFGGAQVERFMDRFGLDETVPLEAGLVTRAIETAQKKVEGFNFDKRKQVVEIDDVINVHRDTVYRLRRRILEVGEGHLENVDWLIAKLAEVSELTGDVWHKHEERIGQPTWCTLVKEFSLPVVDLFWMDHLVDMDQVREGISLRGYAQRDPIVEYKREGHERFGLLMTKIYTSIAQRILSIEQITGKVALNRGSADLLARARYQSGTLETGVAEEAQQVDKVSGQGFAVEAVQSNKARVGRNDLCPCGSGKKYKKCHGKLSEDNSRKASGSLG